MTSPSLARKALGLALGEVVADIRREFKAEMAVQAAEARTLVAELKALAAGIDRDVRERAAAATEAELALMRSAVNGMIEKAEAHVASLEPRKGEPGKNAELPDIGAMVGAAVTKAVAEIEVPQPAPPIDPAPLVEAAVRAVAPIDPTPLVEAAVAKAFEAWPKPVAEPGQDGVGLAGALIDRAGCLVVTLSNGEAKNLGRVVGKDIDEREVQGRVDAMLTEAVKGLRQPEDGKDGLGFDDMDLDEREDGLYLRFAQGEREKSVYLPVPFDRGVYRADSSYRRSNAVTFDGSLWLAQKDAPEGKPGGSPDWRLATKRGRDGKEVVKLPPRSPNDPVKI